MHTYELESVCDQVTYNEATYNKATYNKATFETKLAAIHYVERIRAATSNCKLLYANTCVSVRL